MASMGRDFKAILFCLLTTVAIIALLAGCGKLTSGRAETPEHTSMQQSTVPSGPEGFWTGRGIIWEKALDDPFRKLTRKSEVDFWFVISPMGEVKGKGFISYEAELEAIKWKIPVPNVGEIEAEVRGSSQKELFEFDVTGTLRESDYGTCLLLKAATEEGVEGDDYVIPGLKFEFKIEAMAVTPLTPPAPEARIGFYEIPIEAVAWSPFQGLCAQIQQTSYGCYQAKAESKGEKFYILWYAIQHCR